VEQKFIADFINFDKRFARHSW